MNRTSLCIRMLEILKARSNKNNPMNANEIASELETNPRNIREYKKELITAGYNIQEVKGRYGGYYLDDQCLFPTLRLTSSEEKALLESRSLLETQQYDKKEDYNQAIDKILNTSKDQKIIFPIYMDEPNIKMNKKEIEMFHEAQNALEKGQCLELTYQSKNKKGFETYLVDPYELIHYHHSYYLLGFNHSRNDYRMYRFSKERMKDCIIVNQKFLRDSNFHVEQHIGKSSLFKKPFERIVVKVSPTIVSPFKEVSWGLDFREESEYTYSFLVEDLYVFYRNFFSFGKDVEIVSPQKIIDDYKERLTSTLRIYQR